MDEPPIIAEAKRRKTGLVVLLVGAALLAVLVTGFVVFFVFFQKRSASIRTVRVGRTVAKSAFLDVPESTIPGRYKWTDGPSEFFLVLYDDHTFMNRDGTRFAQYRWEIGPEGLSIQWQNSGSRFTNIEAPGVYTSVTRKGIARMEKLPPYNASQLVPPKPVASIF